MKHLFLLFLLIPVTLFAQVDKKYLAGAVPVVDDRVVFTEELNLPERSQNDIFATLLQWATTRFTTTEVPPKSCKAGYFTPTRIKDKSPVWDRNTWYSPIKLYRSTGL